ncbi:hypothetical protein D3C85_1650690 [compost metagenome]
MNGVWPDKTRDKQAVGTGRGVAAGAQTGFAQRVGDVQQPGIGAHIDEQRHLLLFQQRA